MLFKALKKEHSIQPNTINEHSSPPPSSTYTHIYPLKHTPPSGRRWGLTNRPFISCQSGFIGFKWSLITTVLQSLIMVFFFPYGVGWEEGWGVGCLFPEFSHCPNIRLCISPHSRLSILMKTHFPFLIHLYSPSSIPFPVVWTSECVCERSHTLVHI